MPYPINPVHRLLLEDGSSYLLLDAPGTTTDSYSETNQSSSISLTTTLARGTGQSITGDGNVLSSAKFYLKKTGSPTGNATANIYAHTGTFGTSSLPTSAALATSNVFDIATLTTSFALITFNFTGGNQITLTNGTRYVLTVEWNGGTFSNTVEVGNDNTSPTHSGNYVKQDGSNVWTADSTIDTCFYLLTSIGAADKIVLDEQIALDNPLNGATLSTITPALTFQGNTPAGVSTSSVPVIVQHKMDSSGPTTISFTTAPTVGNTVVVGFGKAVATQPANVTDNKSNVYTLRSAVKETVDSGWSMLWTAPVTTSGGTFTVTCPTGGTVWIAEVSGADLSTVDSNTNFNTSNNTPTVSLSVTANNSLVIITGYDEGTVAQVGNGGVTVVDNEPDNVSHERQVFASGTFQIGTATPGWTNAVTPWSEAAIALHPVVVNALGTNVTYEIQIDTVNTFNGH